MIFFNKIHKQKTCGNSKVYNKRIGKEQFKTAVTVSQYLQYTCMFIYVRG